MLEHLDEFNLLSAVPFPWQQQQWNQLFRQYQRDHLAHSTLVWGQSGLGKTEFVTMFSRFILCQQPLKNRACGRCKSCLLNNSNSHPDLQLLAPEEGSKEIKIDQIRAVTGFVHRTSHAGSAKIVIINQAHRLNINSANALLKTLEEPSENTYLFLITNLPGQLTPTIRSRCQGLQFTAPAVETCRDWLLEKLDEDDVESVLKAAANRPLLALDLAVSGAVSSRQEFVEALTELSRARSPIQVSVNLAIKIGDTTVIEYLLWISSILIKCILTGKGPSDAEESIDKLWSLFHAAEMPPRDLAVALLAYRQEVSIAGNQLTGGANPNPQLVMESLLWRWSELSRQSLG